MKAITDNRFPIYIISRGRWDSRYTVKALDWMNCDYKVIVEEEEYDNYHRYIDENKLLILPEKYIKEYDTCDNYPTQLENPEYPAGAGAARNFAWEHSIETGYDWHWVLDDNIDRFLRLNKNTYYRVKSPVFFKWMEDFVLKYKNIAVAGPHYYMFVPVRSKSVPFQLNSRVYSCLLIRNDIPYRWRSRYNDDTDFNLRVLKDGWCTIVFRAFVQNKATTMTVKGGLYELYKKKGRLIASKTIAKLHPDVCEVKWRFNRWHHYCDYSGFNQKLIRKSEEEIKQIKTSNNIKLIKHRNWENE